MSHSPPLRNSVLDLIRGISAILVCLGHLRNAIFIDHGELPNAGIALKAFYFVTGLGHQAVMVFFVLSGFLVGGSVLRGGAEFRWREYAITRLVRLWVVLLPALILTIFIDRFVIAVAPDAFAGSMFAISHSGPKMGEYDGGPLSFLGNLLFLQGIAVPVYGSNGPLWSLANEFWYYLLFPVMAIAGGIAGNAGPPKRLFLGAASAAVLWVLPAQIRSGYVVWLAGAFAYWLTNRIHPASVIVRRGSVALAVTMLLGTVAYAKTQDASLSSLLPPDLAVGLACALVCAAGGKAGGPDHRTGAATRAIRHVSDMSYSLYLTHFPFVALLGATVFDLTRVVPDLRSALVFATMFMATMGIGWAFWWLFERRTDALRRWIRRSLAQRADVVPGSIFLR